MDPVVTIELPRHLVDAARTTADELKVELAIHLYEQRRLGILVMPEKWRGYRCGNFASY
jgi:hypothetical protein